MMLIIVKGFKCKSWQNGKVQGIHVEAKNCRDFYYAILRPCNETSLISSVTY